MAFCICVYKGYNWEFYFKKNNGPKIWLASLLLVVWKYEFWYKYNSLFKAETDVLIKDGVVLGCTITFILEKKIKMGN